jgi:hypothetical protein
VNPRAAARTALLAAAALMAFGCGSDGSDGSGEEAQQIPAEVADDLAAQSDAVEATLEQGDGCTAKDQAIALRRDVNGYIKDGQVPAELQPEMRERAKDLVDSIHCVQPPPPPAEPQPPPPTDYEEEDD